MVGLPSDGQLVDARGSGEPQGVSLMFQVAIERILANGTGAVSQSITYPAGFDQNVTTGGATVVLEALEKMEKASLAAVSGVVFVGNPYRIPGRRSNVDSQGRPDNRTAFGLFATHVMQANQSIPTYNEEFDQSGKVIDTCLENDVVCATDPDCTCQLASAHMSYGLMQPVQDLIVSHVLDRM
ncbi:Putative cutinase/acetylxylan esterase, alpha/Beta hydrolase [Colletotrichum destructivum]|uniref:Cutinase/acetylxylan esterase, alpha/Beta hydrolase n=1 Tax=Colletotrichum destructivum TaxID=34406 RepID=A0AAX4ITC8_9PEZI|nr:Putative cutinase/acetylxylan esterase, alpha/Beta hydrolase [Colletotrichum destructivum]